MYICSNCGNEALKRSGQCAFCKEWNTLKEFKEARITSSGWKSWEKRPLKELENLSQSSQKPIITSSKELNTLLGWGITPGSVILLSGEPGIGKSTLSLQLADWVKNDIVYVSGEENEAQIYDRAKRLGIDGKNISLLCENSLENILQTLSSSKADLVIIDSISVIMSENISWVAGSISQVKEIAQSLVTYAKLSNTTLIIIGHVTKEWNLAWPKTLEHLVDTVLYFEWERYEDIRILRSLKNRFGSTGEIALFKMTNTGLHDLTNPWLEFISSENNAPTIGSSLSLTMEGNRSIVVEIEALTTYTKFGYPKRSARGIPTPKLDLILAVLWKYSKIQLDSYDVYANIVRGLRIDEPGIDVSIGASIISSKLNIPLSREVIFLGEISLTGKIKNCFWIDKRIREAKKLGFTHVVLPDIDIKISGINLIKIKDIGELVAYINTK